MAAKVKNGCADAPEVPEDAAVLVEPAVRRVDCIDVAPLLNVRESPKGTARIIGTVPHGESLEVRAARNGWVKLASGGYVKEDFLV